MMTLDKVEAMRRVITPWRNREKDYAIKTRLTTLLNTCTSALVEGTQRPELLEAVESQWRELEEYMKGIAH